MKLRNKTALLMGILMLAGFLCSLPLVTGIEDEPMVRFVAQGEVTELEDVCVWTVVPDSATPPTDWDEWNKPNTQSGYYRLRNKQSGKYLTLSGSKLIQADYQESSSDQIWHIQLVPASGNTYIFNKSTREKVNVYDSSIHVSDPMYFFAPGDFSKYKANNGDTSIRNKTRITAPADMCIVNHNRGAHKFMRADEIISRDYTVSYVEQAEITAPGQNFEWTIVPDDSEPPTDWPDWNVTNTQSGYFRIQSKKTQKYLTLSENRLIQTDFDEANDYQIWHLRVTTTNGNVSAWNKATRAMIGTYDDAVTATHPLALFTPDKFETCRNKAVNTTEFISTLITSSTDVCIRHHNGGNYKFLRADELFLDNSKNFVPTFIGQADVSSADDIFVWTVIPTTGIPAPTNWSAVWGAANTQSAYCRIQSKESGQYLTLSGTKLVTADLQQTNDRQVWCVQITSAGNAHIYNKATRVRLNTYDSSIYATDPMYLFEPKDFSLYKANNADATIRLKAKLAAAKDLCVVNHNRGNHKFLSVYEEEEEFDNSQNPGITFWGYDDVPDFSDHYKWIVSPVAGAPTGDPQWQEGKSGYYRLKNKATGKYATAVVFKDDNDQTVKKLVQADLQEANDKQVWHMRFDVSPTYGNTVPAWNKGTGEQIGAYCGGAVGATRPMAMLSLENFDEYAGNPKNQMLFLGTKITEETELYLLNQNANNPNKFMRAGGEIPDNSLCDPVSFVSSLQLENTDTIHQWTIMPVNLKAPTGDPQWQEGKSGYYRMKNKATGLYLTLAGDKLVQAGLQDTNPYQVWHMRFDTSPTYGNTVPTWNKGSGQMIGKYSDLVTDTHPLALVPDFQAYRMDASPLKFHGSKITQDTDFYVLHQNAGKHLFMISGTLPELVDTYEYIPKGTQEATESLTSSVWTMTAEGDYFRISDKRTLKYLTVSGEAVVGLSKQEDDSQLWTVATSYDVTTIRNKQTGAYLALDSTGKAAALSASATDNARWKYTSGQQLSNLKVYTEGKVNQLQMFITDPDSDGSVMLALKNSLGNQQYTLEEVVMGENLYYRIKSAWSTKYLTAVANKRVEEKALMDGLAKEQIWKISEMKSGSYVALNIISVANGLGIALVDSYNNSDPSHLRLVEQSLLPSGSAMWYLNKSTTINTRARTVISPVFPGTFAITSKGEKVVVPPPAVDTRTVYVSAAGSDSNSGLSESQPIKTIGRLNELIKSMPFTAGNTIKLRKGDTFYGTIEINGLRGLKTHPITITHYGTASANPKIIAPPILTKQQVEAELAANPASSVRYNSSDGEIRNGVITSSILIEGCEHVAIDGVDAYSDNNAEAFYQHVKNPSGLIVFSDTIGVTVRNCNLAGNIGRRIKDYLADGRGENRVVGPYPTENDWYASYPPYRGNDYHGLLIADSIDLENGDMTNILVENVTATKLTDGIRINGSTQFIVRDCYVHDSPNWGIAFEDCGDALVSGCKTNNLGYGLNPNGNAAFMVISSQDMVFEDLEMINSQKGPQPYDGMAFDFEGGNGQRNITLKNSVIDGTDGQAIYVHNSGEGTKDFIIDNVFIRNYQRKGSKTFWNQGAIHVNGTINTGLIVNTTVIANYRGGELIPYYNNYPYDIPGVSLVSNTFVSGIDKSALQSLLEKAGKLKESDYTAESWEPFAQALYDAQYVYDSPYSNESSVKDAAEYLSEMMKALVKKPLAEPKAPNKNGGDVFEPPAADDTEPQDSKQFDYESFKRKVEETQGDTVKIKFDTPPVVTAAMWELLHAKGKGLRAEIVDEEGEILYVWVFSEITSFPDMDLTLPAESGNLQAISGLAGKGAQIVPLAFRSRLPGKAQLIVRNKGGYKAGDVLILKYYDEDSGKLVEAGTVSVSSDSRFIAFTLEQGFDYVVEKASVQNAGRPGGAESEKSGKMPVWLLIVIPLAVVLAGGTAAIIIIRRRKAI